MLYVQICFSLIRKKCAARAFFFLLIRSIHLDAIFIAALFSITRFNFFLSILVLLPRASLLALAKLLVLVFASFNYNHNINLLILDRTENQNRSIV